MQATPPPSIAPRVSYIEIARFFATFLIIIYHVPTNDGNIRPFGLDFAIPPIPFFFIVSGFFIQFKDFKSYTQRIALILFPFIVWEAAASIQQLYNHLSASGNSLANFPLNITNRLFNFPANGALWFLRNLIIFTAIAPLLLRYKKHLLLAGLIILSVHTVELIPNQIGPCHIPYDTIYGFAYFLMGVGLQFVSLKKITQFFQGQWLTLLIAFAILACVSELRPHEAHVQFYQEPIIAIFGVLALLSLGYGIDAYAPRFKKIILLLTPACFLAYLMHGLALHYISRLLGASFLRQNEYLLCAPLALLIFALARAMIALMRAYAPKLLPYIAGIKK